MSAGGPCLVVGSGPNGLAAAVTLAAAGHRVRVLEAEDTIGGGTRSAELTLPGFVHDVCSAIHPMAIASPFFQSVPLTNYGVEWIQPDTPLAHPLDDGTAVMLERSLDATARGLYEDGAAYRRLMSPLVDRWSELLAALTAPLFPPRHPASMLRFLPGLRSARGLAESRFSGARARALFAGLAAHSLLPLEAAGAASFALVLGMLGHTVGWPFPRGGSGRIAAALARRLESLGGEVATGHRVQSADELAEARTVMFDLSPRGMLGIAGRRFPDRYARALKRFRHGPAAFKVDWALDGPIPWRAADVARAGTVHLGGTLEDIAAGERAVARGEHPERPFVLLAQQSLFDASRAPAGKHTGWAYCHVPNGSRVDMTTAVERQVERFAPGFRDRILARHVTTPADFESHDANYVGGDIAGGANHLWQMIARPAPRLNPYATPVAGWYLCSASTPPGGGVHGMAGHHAALAALRALG